MDTSVNNLDREAYLKKRSSYKRSSRRTAAIIKRWKREDADRAGKRRKKRV